MRISKKDALEFLELIGGGRLELRASFKLLRQIAGESQVAYASRVGVNPKVVAALEKGGNVELGSLQRLASAAGLRLALVRHPSLPLYSPDERAAEKELARGADARFRASNADNAVRLGDSKLRIPAVPL